MINRTGVLFAGLGGMTASTAAAGLVAISNGLFSPVFGVTSGIDFQNRQLSDLEGWVVGGWDYDQRPLSEVVKEYGFFDSQLTESITDKLRNILPYSPVIGPLDAEPRTGIDSCDLESSLGKGAKRVQDNIDHFRNKHGCDQIIVAYLGSPPSTGTLGSREEEVKNQVEFAGVHCYLYGSILAGAHFFDFTPTDALECQFFLDLAVENSVQLAGRDGSTGQTMLKLHIAELLRRRSFHLNAWYSTNILGNNDGHVLSIPAHRIVKIQDKKNGLPQVLGYDDFDHVVDISFVRSHGDSKESWDVINCEGWLGSPLSIRINWRGQDSFLAAPMVLDICRLLDQGARCNRMGLQCDLGFFFKNPIGNSDIRPSVLYSRLLDWVDMNHGKS
jgi:myo-inositol-1-phosphate synthase